MSLFLDRSECKVLVQSNSKLHPDSEGDLFPLISSVWKSRWVSDILLLSKMEIVKCRAVRTFELLGDQCAGYTRDCDIMTALDYWYQNRQHFITSSYWISHATFLLPHTYIVLTSTYFCNSYEPKYAFWAILKYGLFWTLLKQGVCHSRFSSRQMIAHHHFSVMWYIWAEKWLGDLVHWADCMNEDLFLPPSIRKSRIL